MLKISINHYSIKDKKLLLNIVWKVFFFEVFSGPYRLVFGQNYGLNRLWTKSPKSALIWEKSQNMEIQAVNLEVFYFSILTKNMLICIFDFYGELFVFTETNFIMIMTITTIVSFDNSFPIFQKVLSVCFADFQIHKI